ncbi:MAG: nitrite/sulfite reductase [Acidobacteria bacterium]|nr:nitrite/sulfite reductase [Acidobacteriota bacterium]
MDDSRTVGRSRLSFADEHAVDEFVTELRRFERGEIDADTWRRFRLLRGTYGQRQDGVQMLRIKIPQGILSAPQIATIADIADDYSRGFCHVTTRQNIQLHFIPLPQIETAMRRLAAVGLTTREACGNSVRNVTACPYAGVARDEAFDVTPYAEALTRFLLGHRLSSTLPRKFKIAFEGCPTDHALASINDLGWTAVRRDTAERVERGFRLTAGGGTSIMATSGRVLYEFLPAAEMLDVAEAVLRVFHDLGDYEHRQRNRMKFLIKTLGWDRFKSHVFEAVDAVRADGGARLPFDPDDPPQEAAPSWPQTGPPSLDDVRALVVATGTKGPGMHPSTADSEATAGAERDWRHTNVFTQRQGDYAVAVVRLDLGDITSGQLRVLARLSQSYGDGTVRLTPDQNVFLRWVRHADVRPLFERLCAAGLAGKDAATARDVTSCPGAESCRLAVTQSRGIARNVGDLLQMRPDLVQATSGASIRVSGCPNGCGQHHVATLGLQGSIRKVDGRAVPQYFLLVGGHAANGGSTFGRLAAKVPARRTAAAIERLLLWYRDDRLPDETPDAFFARADLATVRARLADLETLTSETVTPDDFIDLGDVRPFAPEVMDGECAV